MVGVHDHVDRHADVWDEADDVEALCPVVATLRYDEVLGLLYFLKFDESCSDTNTYIDQQASKVVHSYHRQIAVTAPEDRQ